MTVLTDIPHVLSGHVELEGLPDGTINTVTVLDTDLVLDADAQGYDKAAVDQLQKDLYNQIKTLSYDGKIRVRTR